MGRGIFKGLLSGLETAAEQAVDLRKPGNATWYGIRVHEAVKVERLLAVEKNDDTTEIVIHVNMLKEGWDVINLYTIIPLRSANARTLVEQSIGRANSADKEEFRRIANYLLSHNYLVRCEYKPQDKMPLPNKDYQKAWPT